MDGESLVRQTAGTLITPQATRLRDAVEQTIKQQALQREIDALEKKIAAEPQPLRKFVLHHQLIELKNKMKQWIN